MNKSAKLDEIAGNLTQSIGASGPGIGLAPTARSIHRPPPIPGVRGKPLYGFEKLPIDQIEADEDQPREEFDDESLRALGANISRRGLLQPIVVRRVEGGRYVLIAGERRWRASIMAGLKEIEARIYPATLTPEEIFVAQMVENMAREDLSPAEQAKSFAKLRDTFGYTQTQIAEELGFTKSKVSRTFALIDLPAPVFDLVEAGELPPSTALAIARKHQGDESKMVEVATTAAMEKVTRDSILPSPESCTVQHLPVNGVESDGGERSSDPVATAEGGESAASRRQTQAEYPLGTRVKLSSGPLSGRPGTVTSHDSGTAKVMVDLDCGSGGYCLTSELVKIPSDPSPAVAEAAPKYAEVVKTPIRERYALGSAEGKVLSAEEEENAPGIVWGCDLPDGITVSVEGPDGTKIVRALYAAIERYQCDEADRSRKAVKP